jgi:predicted  nucleic acid-binding Zn-ribbon protein
MFHRGICYPETIQEELCALVKKRKLKERVRHADSAVGSLVERVDYMQNSIDTRDEVIAQLKQQNGNLERRAASLQEERSEMRSKIAALEAKLPNIRSIIRDARAESPENVESRVTEQLKKIFDAQIEEVKKLLAEPDPVANNIAGPLCSICLDEPPGCLVMPCRHLCMCKGCYEELHRSDITACPMCRGIMGYVITDIYTP